MLHMWPLSSASPLFSLRAGSPCGLRDIVSLIWAKEKNYSLCEVGGGGNAEAETDFSLPNLYSQTRKESLHAGYL